MTPSTPEPLEGVSTRAPLEGASTRAPLEGASTRAPLEGASTREPLEGVSTREPLDGVSIREPLEGASTHAPFEGVSTRALVRGALRALALVGLVSVAVGCPDDADPSGLGDTADAGVLVDLGASDAGDLGPSDVADATAGDDGGTSDDLGTSDDAGEIDGGAGDLGGMDLGGPDDAGRSDAASGDSGPGDGGAAMDAGSVDGGPSDVGSVDGGPGDGGAAMDAGSVDGGPDGGQPDAGSPSGWTALATAPISGRAAAASAWSGTELLVWGGISGGRSGARYDPALDTWASISTTGAPTARVFPAAAWTGQRLFVFGGLNETTFAALGGGALYDPARDTWQALPTSPFSGTSAGPLGRPAAVWTGSEVVVFDEGAARYDPSAGRWTNTATTGRPTARGFAAAVWTGTEAVVWGGVDRTFSSFNDGARYDPALDRWTPMASAGAPSGRALPAAAWTGSELLVWGGYDPGNGVTIFGDGARYDPTLDRWTPMASTGAPTGRLAAAHAWTGTELIIWGGLDSPNTTSGRPLGDGAAYDPATDRWRALGRTGAPQARHSAAYGWTGRELLIWGGSTDSTYAFVLGDGARISP